MSESRSGPCGGGVTLGAEVVRIVDAVITGDAVTDPSDAGDVTVARRVRMVTEMLMERRVTARSETGRRP